MVAPAVAAEPTGLYARINDILRYHRTEGTSDVRIHVAAISWEGDEPTSWENERIYTPTGGRFTRVFQMLQNSLLHRNVDVIHASNLLPFANWIYPILSINKPLLVGPNNTGKVFPPSMLGDETLRRIKLEKGNTLRRWRLYGEFVEKLRLNMMSNHPGGPTKFIALSSFAQQILQKRGIESDDITVLPSGVPIDLFHPTGSNANWPVEDADFRLLFVGKPTRRKGIDVLATSVADLIKSNNTISPSVVILGRDQPPDFLKGHPGLKNMNFLGQVPRRDLAQYYRTADAFVTPSYYESESTVMIEALACGTPVVATNDEPFTEVGNRDNSCFFKRGDPDHLGAKLCEVAENIESYSKQAREQAAIYDIKNTYNCLIEVYRQLA